MTHAGVSGDAAGVKKGNTELLNEVNAALRDLKESGEWLDLFHQWVSETDNPPVPPQEWRHSARLRCDARVPHSARARAP